MFRGALLAVAACGFHGPGLIDDAHPPGDAPVARDAAPHPDATPDAVPDAPPCTQHPSDLQVAGGTLGGAGGSLQPALACAGSGIPVGLALDVTQAPLGNHNNELAVVAIHVRCGTIIGGATVLGEVITSGGAGTANCSSYANPRPSTELLCPPGAAIVAIDGNELDTSLYNSVVVTCSNGTMLPFPTSGAWTNQPQHATCPPNTVVAGFAVRAGCGQDQLALQCAALTCN